MVKWASMSEDFFLVEWAKYKMVLTVASTSTITCVSLILRNPDSLIGCRKSSLTSDCNRLKTVYVLQVLDYTDYKAGYKHVINTPWSKS